MNIFYLHKKPRDAAEMHCDKHCIKMILETSQLLSTAHRVLDGDMAPMGIYKATHVNHPCSVWVRSGYNQYQWAFNLFSELLKEYTHRYGKEHACTKMLALLIRPPLNMDKDAEWVDPPQCMPDECKVEGDPVQAYRNYYNSHKAHFARWTNRKVPKWFVSECGG